MARTVLGRVLLGMSVSVWVPVFGAVSSSEISANGIVGQFHAQSDAHGRVGVIMLNGSDGGIPPAQFAADLAAAGFPTLALAYSQDEQGEPAAVPEVAPFPLEYEFRAIEWMKARPEVDSKRIVLMGLSRGAELALLIGSLRKDVAGVVAYSPGSHVWGAPSKRHGYVFDTAAWTLDGKPVPYQVHNPDFKLPVREWFARADNVEAAAIEVERIHGPILLISSKADGEWPASVYADEMEARLKVRHFRYPVNNLQYEDASHLLMGYGPAITKLVVPGTTYVIDFGGSPEGTSKARDAGWAAAKKFLASLR